MGWAINKTFDDNKQPKPYQSTIVLSPDKELSYQTKGPILWSGKLNSSDIEIIQPHIHDDYLQDFEFKTFPSEYDYLKTKIVGFIVEYVFEVTD